MSVLLELDLIIAFLVGASPLLACYLQQELASLIVSHIIRTVNRGRKSAQTYLQAYGEIQGVKEVTKELAGVMQEYTQRGGVRPFGVSILVAGTEDGEPALFQVDPSGAYFGWKATAIGKNYVNAKNFLEKRWNSDMGLEDEMTAFNIQVGICKANGTFQVLTPAQVQDYLDEAN